MKPHRFFTNTEKRPFKTFASVFTKKLKNYVATHRANPTQNNAMYKTYVQRTVQIPLTATPRMKPTQGMLRIKPAQNNTRHKTDVQPRIKRR